MAKKVQVCVLRTAGTNCDLETGFAFSHFGANVSFVHINELLTRARNLSDFHILALPGGFTYGDDIAAGRILANELRLKLGEDIRKFIEDQKLLIGICNGFQVLVKAGILPGEKNDPSDFSQQATLMINDSCKFEDRWAHLKPSGTCVWTEGICSHVFFPVAHAEGKFVPKDSFVLESIKENQQVIFRYSSGNGNNPVYPENPNGSVDDIAGISDPTGRVLGLMPHPERHFYANQHPFWTREKNKSKYGDGAVLFKNGVNYIKTSLL